MPPTLDRVGPRDDDLLEERRAGETNGALIFEEEIAQPPTRGTRLRGDGSAQRCEPPEDRTRVGGQPLRIGQKNAQHRPVESRARGQESLASRFPPGPMGERESRIAFVEDA
ncbi:MAG: hypothetical protein N2038_12815 [Geminicoccaceae bacterium]|nr:hypothetical protein [Geminicoccaceae bacterium]MCX7631114.1 hypothetical protein [Geminicoccaceae bacterium]